MSDATRPVCSIEGCGKRSRSMKARWCEMHYHRWYEHGDPLYVRSRPDHHVADHGYIRINKTHPLWPGHGQPYEHRVVLMSVIGQGVHPCHWCGRAISWEAHRKAPDALTVDHLDHDRANNHPSNLVPSCGPCNITRQPNRRSVQLAARARNPQAFEAANRLLAVNSRLAWDRATPEQRAERGRRVSEGKQRAAAARRQQQAA